MNKRLITIVSCLIILAASVVLLLVFLVVNPSNKDALEGANEIKISVNDVSLSVGEEVKNFYYINDLSAEITFEVEKPEIASVTKYSISGLKVGETIVKITAKNSKFEESKSFKIKVSEKSLRLEIAAVKNCKIVDTNILQCLSNSVQFTIYLYDDNDNLLDDFQFSVSSDEPVIVRKNLFNVNIILYNNCLINIYIMDYDINFNITAICMV